MSRLQKKCLIASSTLHALLVLIVLTSSAFLLKDEESVDQQVLTFIPDRLVDEPLRRAPSGAQPSATPPAANTQPPQSQPPAPPTVKPPEPDPVPPKKQPEPAKPQPDPPKPEPVKKQEPKKPEPEPKKEPQTKVAKVDPTEAKKSKEEPKKSEPIKIGKPKLVVRENPKVNADRESQRRAETTKAQEELAARQEKALSGLQGLVQRISTPGVEPSSLDLGTVGVSYASLDAWIRKVYMDAWQKPADMQAGEFSVMVRVVIRRDGTVESHSITDPSGISKLDKSVRDVLARVKTIGMEFPEGAREEKRSYTIEFNLKATTGAG